MTRPVPEDARKVALCLLTRARWHDAVEPEMPDVPAWLVLTVAAWLVRWIAGRPVRTEVIVGRSYFRSDGPDCPELAEHIIGQARYAVEYAAMVEGLTHPAEADAAAELVLLAEIVDKSWRGTVPEWLTLSMAKSWCAKTSRVEADEVTRQAVEFLWFLDKLSGGNGDLLLDAVGALALNTPIDDNHNNEEKTA
jgi:hypothetical protein